MSDPEKNLDQLIRRILSEEDSQSQPTANFKQNIMVQAALIHARHKGRFGSSRVWVFYSIGILFYACIAVALIILWRNGTFSGLFSSVSSFMDTIMTFSPLRTIQFLIIGLAAYVVLIRGLFTAFLFKTTKQNTD